MVYLLLKMKRFMNVQATLKLNFIKSRLGESSLDMYIGYCYSNEVVYGV